MPVVIGVASRRQATKRARQRAATRPGGPGQPARGARPARAGALPDRGPRLRPQEPRDGRHRRGAAAGAGGPVERARPRGCFPCRRPPTAPGWLSPRRLFARVRGLSRQGGGLAGRRGPSPRARGVAVDGGRPQRRVRRGRRAPPLLGAGRCRAANLAERRRRRRGSSTPPPSGCASPVRGRSRPWALSSRAPAIGSSAGGRSRRERRRTWPVGRRPRTSASTSPACGR